MSRRRKPAVQRYHDRVAGRYDASYADAYWQWHDSLTWDYLKPFLPRDQTAPILDLGCGTGRWAAKLAKSGYAVTCVDISGAMLERARRKIDGISPTHRAEFVQADLIDLGALPGETFSLAVAFGEPIGCSTAPAKALKEIRRRLLPEGVLVATFDNRFAAIDYYLENGDPAELATFLRHGRTHWLTKNPDERFDIYTHAPTDVDKLLTGAGFTVEDMVGKTVLPMRHYRSLLADAEGRRRWARIEKGLCRDRAAMGRAPHLQVAARLTRKKPA